jgi:hypothetical protein
MSRTLISTTSPVPLQRTVARTAFLCPLPPPLSSSLARAVSVLALMDRLVELLGYQFTAILNTLFDRAAPA